MLKWKVFQVQELQLKQIYEKKNRGKLIAHKVEGRVSEKAADKRKKFE